MDSEKISMSIKQNSDEKQVQEPTFWWVWEDGCSALMWFWDHLS